MNKLTNQQLFEITELIGKLKKVKRTGWVLQGIEDAESVAEHSYRLAFLALLLAQQENLDPLKLVKMAMVHDLGEAIVGDIKWEEGTEIVGSQEGKRKDEKRVIEDLFGKDDSLKEYVELLEEFNVQSTKEAKLIKKLDKIEMTLQALEYQQDGHPKESLSQFWDNSEKYLQDSNLMNFFEFLRRKREK